MKIYLILIGFFVLISCNGQDKTALETIKYNHKVPFTNNLEKDFSIVVPLKGIYKVKDITQFKLFGFDLKNEKIKFSDEEAEYQNLLNIVVDNYTTNQYYGFELELYDENISNKILELLKKKYGNPIKKYEYQKLPSKDFVYLWQNKATSEVIYYNLYNEGGHQLKGKEAILSETKIVIIRDSLSAKPYTNDPRNTPEKIENLLKENPKAFDLAEILKNQIP